MLSIVFIVAFFSIFLLPLTCIFFLFSSGTQTRPNYPLSKSCSMGSVWRLLLRYTVFRDGSTEQKDAVGVRRREGGEEAAECAVCLCGVEEGDEISDLRCNHVFHKVCLDAWIGSGRSTCPLCRGGVFSPAVAEDGACEVVMFQFCPISGSRRSQRESNWWLR